MPAVDDNLLPQFGDRFLYNEITLVGKGSKFDTFYSCSFWMLCLETSEVNVKEQNSNNISVKNKH